MIIYIIALFFLAAVALFLELIAGLSAYWQFRAVFLGAGCFFMILTVLALRRPKVVLAYFLVFSCVIVSLHYVAISANKPFTQFYVDLHEGMTEHEVFATLEDHFPKDGKYSKPVVSRNGPDIWFQLDPKDGRFNSEFIAAKFQNGYLKGARYLPD